MVASIDTAIQCAGGPGRQPMRLEFPGCLEMRLTRAEVERYEGHIEFWDARTGLAMMAEPHPALAHEFPAQRLAKLATLIAPARGVSVAWTSRSNSPRELEHTPVDRLMQAALECRNEDDFLKRLRTG